MSNRPKLCKKIELVSYYFEDGAVDTSIKLLEECLAELKAIQKKRQIFFAKLEKDIANSK